MGGSGGLVKAYKPDSFHSFFAQLESSIASGAIFKRGYTFHTPASPPLNTTSRISSLPSALYNTYRLPCPHWDVCRGRRSACQASKPLSLYLKPSFCIHSSFEMSSAVTRSHGRYFRAAVRSFCMLINSSFVKCLRALSGWSPSLDRISRIRSASGFDGPES